MKRKFCTIVFLLGVSYAWLCSEPAFATVEWVTVYETDFATNKGWQTNNANNYYLDSAAPGGSPAYFQRQIDASEEYAYHLLPGFDGGGPVVSSI